MANERISDLPSVASIQATDLIEVSEPTGGSPAYASKKALVSQILAAAGAGQLAMLGLDGDPGEDGMIGPPGAQGPAGTNGGGGSGSSGARVILGTPFSVPNNASTAISWDTVAFDTNGYHGVANPTRLTAPVAGIYLVSATMYWTANSTGEREAEFVINNSPSTSVGVVCDQPLATPDFGQAFSTTLNLNAGDYVEVRAFQNSGAALNIQATRGLSTFSMTLMTAAAQSTVNQTPDTHPTSPTIWDDEFEGTSLDTTGTRRTGANPWTIYNALTSSNSQANGSLVVNSAIGAGGGTGGRAITIIGQPVPAGTAWKFRSKFAMQSQSSGNLCGLSALESGTQKSVNWGWLFNPGHTVVAFACSYTNYSNFGQDLDNVIGGSDLAYQLIDSFTNKTPMRWWEMERNGGNLIVRLSDDGYFYQTYITIPIATYFTSAPDTIGLAVDAVAVADATHLYADWFRRVA